MSPFTTLEPIEKALEQQRRALGAGWVVLHGAAFELGGRRMLALGGSRAGKSTLVAAVIKAGGRAVSDDLLVCHACGDLEFSFLRVRNFLSFRTTGFLLLPPKLRVILRQYGVAREIRWSLVPSAAPFAFKSQMRGPTSIWLCQVDCSGFRTSLLAAGQGEVLATLLASTSSALLAQEQGEVGGVMYRTLINLAQSAAGFHVRLGYDLLSDPVRVLAELLSATHPHLPPIHGPELETP